MSSDVAYQPAIYRYISVAALGIITLAGGTTFTVNKLTPTTTIRQEAVTVIRSSSGTGLKLDGYGNLTVSGAIISDGVQISTGSSLTLTNGDSRYVNTSGDTMTGALNVYGANITASGARVDGTVTVDGTMSGRTLYVSGMNRMRRIVAIPLCDSATACAVGSGVTFRIPNMLAGYTLSGATLDASVAGVTGTMTVSLYNQGGNCHVFSTAIQLDSTEQSSDTAATPYVISSTCRVFSSGQRLVPQITAVHSGSAAKGVTLNLDFVP